MADYAKRVKNLLKENGWKVIRQPRGSHEIWSKNGMIVAVPTKLKNRHTANGILKLAGLSKI